MPPAVQLPMALAARRCRGCLDESACLRDGRGGHRPRSGAANTAARGTTRAVLLSSVLCGAMYLTVWFGAASAVLNFAGGRDAVIVGVWVLMLVGIGVGFAAVVVVTGTIWPPVVIRAVLYFASALQFGADDSAARGSALWSAAWHSARSPPPTASGCCTATCTGTTATRVRTPRSQHPRTIPSGP